jgi:peptidoglycan lytic transglycosylase
MFVPAPPAQPAVALAPIGIAENALSLEATPIERPLGSTVQANSIVRVHTRTLNVLRGHAATVTGTLRAEIRSAGLPGRMVALQQLGRGGWRTIARVRSGAGGHFRLRFLARRMGSERVRVRFGGDALDRGSQRNFGRLNVYRLAEASWYGGGGEMACGGALTSSTLGVASKTLPCGTLVVLRYGGHSIRVPVVDRGPYVAGREFDLTEATKRAIGFGGTGEVWSTR